MELDLVASRQLVTPGGKTLLGRGYHSGVRLYLRTVCEACVSVRMCMIEGPFVPAMLRRECAGYGASNFF